LLLYFSWQPLAAGASEPLLLDDYLHEKMNLIFEELASHHRDQGYECIAPSHLLNILNPRSTTQEKRRKICNFLSDVIAQQRR
jgi:hypothetical protein